MAGYLYNESGDYKKALGHLEQADNSEPFHTLLLARAYEGSGAIARATPGVRQDHEDELEPRRASACLSGGGEQARIFVIVKLRRVAH